MTFSKLVMYILLLNGFGGCTSRYYEQYKSESMKRIPSLSDTTVVTENDIAHLPLLVQRYLHFTGAVGKPRIHNFRLRVEGEMKRKIGGDWMTISAQQYEFFTDMSRLFYIKSSLYGIPFDGFHRYVGDHATMQITVASLVQIVDAKGDTMDHSETVTLFNDMCLLAPSTLIDSTIRWVQIDSSIVKAIFTNRKQTVSALLTFDPSGKLINFSSQDRYLSEDGKSYHNYVWSTPIYEYKIFSGWNIVSTAEAVWQMPEGVFTYARFRIVELEYNCRTFK